MRVKSMYYTCIYKSIFGICMPKDLHGLPEKSAELMT